ncbi:MAG: IPTL-CTERM sorting domain-containing protein [Vicinamibacteria bacterium]|jgi:hypothetical protein
MKRIELIALGLVAPSAHAGLFNSLSFLTAIPTLDEVGLGLLIALVAGVAGWAVRKRSGHR